MIRCRYTSETLDTVAKTERRRAIGCGGFLYGWFVLALIGVTIQDPGLWFRGRDVLFVLGCGILWMGMLYFFHRLLANVERMTLKHAGDEITLDDEEIRLTQTDGTQIVLPRKGLRIRSPYYAAGRMIFTIRNTQFNSGQQIVLTSDMENARELVEAIRPGSWDTGSE